MKSEKRYFSELFLQVLERDFTRGSVIKALETCEEEFGSRMADMKSNDKESDSLQKTETQEDLEGLALRNELMDFWDVYHEFDELFSEQEKEAFQILQAVRKIQTA